jgi:polysaccharide biosynthesis/export protein
MKKKDARNFFLPDILITCLCALLFIGNVWAVTLSKKTLQDDLNYYRKVSSQQNLNANDRYHILFRIETKYKSSKVDMAPLMQEFSKIKTTEVSAPNVVGSVSKIETQETNDESRILVTAENVKRSNYFLLKDPEPGRPQKLVLDLYGVKEDLSEALKNIPLDKGIFSDVRTEQFEREPNYIVRVEALMREIRPYKVVRQQNDLWVIIGSKTDEKKQAVSGTPDRAPETPKEKILAKALETPKPVIEEDSFKDYQIEPGDILAVSILPAQELSREVIVQPDGNIAFPLIGLISAKGKTAKELGSMLQTSLKKYIANPKVKVSVKKFSGMQIFVTGEVRSVGSYNYKENLKLLQFISSIGGFTNEANRQAIKIYRGAGDKRKTFTVNIEDIISSGDLTKDFILQPGDIIEVPKGNAKVSILGDIKTPGFYELKENMRLLELVSLAGGFTETAKISKISIINEFDASTPKKVREVNLNRILSGKDDDVPINKGDTVYIPKKNIATANWFLNNIMPWLSLISLILVLSGTH